MRYKILFLIFVLILLLTAGCGKKTVRAGYGAPTRTDTDVKKPITDVDEMDQQKCITDADCVPIPSCHPRACINKAFEDIYRKPDVCTEIFDCSAAYKAEDCLCIEGKCKNSRMGKSCE